MNGATIIQKLFYRHKVVWLQQAGRTATGPQPAVETTINHASINTQAVPYVDENGTEIITSATVCWHPDHGVPQLGDHITLPTEFAIKPRRRVVAARLAESGIPMLPNHVEIRLQ